MKTFISCLRDTLEIFKCLKKFHIQQSFQRSWNLFSRTVEVNWWNFLISLNFFEFLTISVNLISLLMISMSTLFNKIICTCIWDAIWTKSDDDFTTFLTFFISFPLVCGVLNSIKILSWSFQFFLQSPSSDSISIILTSFNLLIFGQLCLSTLVKRFLISSIS